MVATLPTLINQKLLWGFFFLFFSWGGGEGGCHGGTVWPYFNDSVWPCFNGVMLAVLNLVSVFNKEELCVSKLLHAETASLEPYHNNRHPVGDDLLRVESVFTRVWQSVNQRACSPRWARLYFVMTHSVSAHRWLYWQPLCWTLCISLFCWTTRDPRHPSSEEKNYSSGAEACLSQI